MIWHCEHRTLINGLLVIIVGFSILKVLSVTHVLITNELYSALPSECRPTHFILTNETST